MQCFPPSEIGVVCVVFLQQISGLIWGLDLKLSAVLGLNRHLLYLNVNSPRFLVAVDGTG